MGRLTDFVSTAKARLSSGTSYKTTYRCPIRVEIPRGQQEGGIAEQLPNKATFEDDENDFSADTGS